MTEPAGQTASSLNALTNDYYTITHNIANADTTGYKRKVNSFVSELADRMNAGREVAEQAAEVSAEGAVDFSQGNMVETGRTLDVAVGGSGFLVAETPQGPIYTRNGVLQIGGQGQLVDIEGRVIAGADGPIMIPAGVSELGINIGADGTVTAGTANLGRLKIVDFGQDRAKLIAAGSGFRAPADVQAMPDEKTTVRQGYRENSNVNITEELVGLITVSRLYEANMNILKKSQENTRAMLDVANS